MTTRHRWFSASPACVVANSRYTLERHLVAGYFPRARQYVVANAAAVRKSRTPPDGVPTTAARRRAKQSAIPSAARPPVCIGYVGRLLPYKGVELLLEALALLPKHLWCAKIAGAGTGSYERKLHRRAETLGLAVDFLGWTSQDEFFPQIDFLVIPSIIAEPQGLGIYEAVSRGIPVIYSDRGGLAELAASTPGTVPFAANSVDDLARVLRRLLQHPLELQALWQSAATQSASLEVERYGAAYMEIYAEARKMLAGPDAGRPERRRIPPGADSGPAPLCSGPPRGPGQAE